MLQMTPESAKPGAAPEDLQTSDDWQRLSLILKTVEEPGIARHRPAPETVLWRLFHEDEVRCSALPIAFRCDCAPDRIAQVLKSYAPGGTRRPGRSRWHDPRPLRILRRHHEIAPDSLG